MKPLKLMLGHFPLYHLLATLAVVAVLVFSGCGDEVAPPEPQDSGDTSWIEDKPNPAPQPGPRPYDPHPYDPHGEPGDGSGYANQELLQLRNEIARLKNTRVGAEADVRVNFTGAVIYTMPRCEGCHQEIEDLRHAGWVIGTDGRSHFETVNIQGTDDEIAAACEKRGITGFPTTAFFVNGREQLAKRVVGYDRNGSSFNEITSRHPEADFNKPALHPLRTSQVIWPTQPVETAWLPSYPMQPQGYGGCYGGGCGMGVSAGMQFGGSGGCPGGQCSGFRMGGCAGGRCF